jgi:putative sterol carrier protein
VANYDSVATPEGGAGIVETAVQAFGRVDVLINNAGILQDKSFANMDPASWHAVIGVHLDGAYHVTRAALPAMQKFGFGRIVMTTSAAGLYGNFGQTNYAAAKMGLLGFAQTVKQEVRKYNIHINTVAPVASSRLTAGVLPPEVLAHATPEKVASMVLMLCSDACQSSGGVFNCGMGYVSRAAIITAPGTQIGDVQAPPTPEQIHAHWHQINSLQNGREFDNAQEAVMALFAPADPTTPPADDVSSPTSTVAEIFAKMPDAFNAAAAQDIRAVFQFHISGQGGGDWFCVIEDEACSITAGTHAQPVCTLTMDAEDFVALAGGRLSAMQAFTAGKLKIAGDIIKSQLIEKLFRFPF